MCITKVTPKMTSVHQPLDELATVAVKVSQLTKKELETTANCGAHHTTWGACIPRSQLYMQRRTCDQHTKPSAPRDNVNNDSTTHHTDCSQPTPLPSGNYQLQQTLPVTANMPTAAQHTHATSHYTTFSTQPRAGYPTQEPTRGSLRGELQELQGWQRPPAASWAAP
jgi:hypothetical protein